MNHIFLLLALFVSNYGRADVALENVHGVVPDLPFYDSSHRLHHLSEYRGENLIIHFWASWCKPCQKELPDLEKLSLHLKGENTVFIPISIDEPLKAEESRKVLNSISPALVFNIAEAGKARDQFLTWGVPVTYFVDSSGQLRARALGARNWLEEKDTHHFLERVFKKDK